MLVLGHVGIGTRLLLGLRRKLPWWPLVAGCLLPDLIDKPLFYGLRALHRLPPLISGTRTFGHTGLLFLLVLLCAALVRRPWLWALAAGMATHLCLDILGELIIGAEPDTSIGYAILFPLRGVRFPVAHFDTVVQQLKLNAENLYVVVGEIAGGAILLRAYLRRRYSS